MICRDYQMMISKELDGEIGRVEAEALRVHLGTCAACSRFRARLEALNAAHQALDEAYAPPTVLPAVMAATEVPAPARGIALRLRIALSVAAVIILLAGIAAGDFLARAFTVAPSEGYTEVLALEYFEEYPPGSVGEALIAAAEGGGDEQR